MMPFNPRALRFRLAAWHTGVLAVVFILLGVLLFARLKSYLDSTLLEIEARRARLIGETLIARIPSTGEAGVSKEIESIYAPERTDRFIRVTRRDGAVISISGPPNDQSFDPSRVPPATAPGRGGEFLHEVSLEGGGKLIVATVEASAAGAVYWVDVGTSAEPVDSLLRHLVLLLGLGLPVVVLVAAGGGYVLVNRALRPVASISARAELITQNNLDERLPVAHTGDELERLAESLNRMITRLDDAFQNSKRFVADASHELRTPLTVLRGELESLVQARSAPKDIGERLASLLEEVERLTKIVERLLALSRLDAGEAQMERVPVDLAALTAGTADQMSLLAEDKRISVSCQASGPVWVEGDRVRLKEVVVNLIDNAVKYTPEGGAVSLTIASEREKAVLEVADTGNGIEADALPHIFERFFRADPSRSQKPEGAGLGLSIVKSICTAHGGKVEVESAVGRGSRFRVEFPLATEKAPPFPNKAPLKHR